MEILHTNKLGEMENSAHLWKIKNDEKLVQSITKLKNCLIDLKTMVTSNLAKIFHLIDKDKVKLQTNSLILIDR